MVYWLYHFIPLASESEQMKKTTSKLVAGDVMGSGEIVISCEKSTGFGQSNPKGRIVLKNPKTGKTRVASWNWWGTVFLMALAGEGETPRN